MPAVRQSCPLSPTLSVMCIEPRANMARAHKHYKGLICPHIKEPLKISMFADDTFFIIKNQKDHGTALKLLKAKIIFESHHDIGQAVDKTVPSYFSSPRNFDNWVLSLLNLFESNSYDF
jgi:hypothetical protein